jgi:hypothetical protein
MNKSVPTLLGIVIILLVVVLVVLIYNFKMTQEMGKGGIPVGTVGGEKLLGVETPKEQIDASTVLGSKEPTVEKESIVNNQGLQRREGRLGREGRAPGTTPGAQRGGP